MEFGPGTYGLGILAGLLSTLSPCVLPLIPITVGSAVSAHRRGPLALAAGLTLSFALMGTLIAYAGTSGVLTGTGVKRGGTGGLPPAGIDAPAGDVAGLRGRRHHVHRLVQRIEGARSRHAECSAGRGAALYIRRSGRFRRASCLAGRCAARVDQVPDAARYQQHQTDIHRPAMRIGPRNQ